jgi:CTP synthase
VGEKLLAKLNLVPKKMPDWSTWQRLVTSITAPRNRIRIALIGKYCKSGEYTISDSYLSIYQALIHACAQADSGVTIEWLDAQELETNGALLASLADYDGILVPGGFGAMGVEGKIKAITYARTHGVPYLGLCYGMQLAVVEYARMMCGLSGAHTLEVDPCTPHPVVTILEIQKKILAQNALGGTMRLGAYSAQLQPGSRVMALYQNARRVDAHGRIYERHRHRYEVHPDYIDLLEAHGLRCSGYHEREDGTKLVEFIEIPTHPFFIATQAHPEFKSRLGNPSPLFQGYVQACLVHQQQREAGAKVVLQPLSRSHAIIDK